MKSIRMTVLQSMAALALLAPPSWAGDLEVARVIARGDLENAAQNPKLQSDSSWRRIVKNVTRAFGRAKFLQASPGKTWTGCADDQAVLAYVHRGETTVYMCPLSFSESSDFVAQVMVHEATHVSGNFDECDTSDTEFTIRTLAGKRPFKNGYADSCGLSGRFSFASDGPSGADWGVDRVKNRGAEGAETDWQ